MITEQLQTVLNFYAQPGVMSEPGPYAAMLEQLPDTVPALVQTLQGLVIHVFWTEQYGVKLADERNNEVTIRPVQAKLARMLELDPRPLGEPRPLELRLVSNCRDISLLLASMLKVKGIPARARCGFGRYFMPDHYEDHWMTEYWNAGEQRWVQVDAQMDALQQKALNLPFDPLDMPQGQFVLAGEAWQMARDGREDPDKFGIFEWHGGDFIRGNVMRDLLSLNKIELLPWDFWGMMQTPVAELTPEQLALVDQAAALTLAGNEAFEDVRAIYESNECFHPTADLLK